MQFKFWPVAVALALPFLAGHAGAVGIAVTNHDFEAVTRADGGIAAGDFAPGWAFVGGTHGVYNPSTTYYANALITDPPNAGVIGTMSGKMVAFIFNAASTHLTTTTAHAVVAGETYQLTVAVGQRGLGSLGSTYIALWDGDSQLARRNITAADLAANTFTDVALTYTATAADAGALRVRLGQDGGNYSDFDNVRLATVTAVPEPASWALLAAGAALLGLRRRRAA